MPLAAGTRELDRRIAAVALPATVGLLTEPLYELCDTAILGHLGTRQLAAAALASRILSLGHATFVFLMFATTASVARLRGAGRDRDAAAEGVTAAWLGAVIGLGAAVVMLIAGRPLIAAFGGRGGVARDAWTYLWISLAGYPAVLVVLAGTGYLRGTEDTRLPLRIAAAAVAANLVGEVVAVIVLGFGIGASALTTVAAKWGAALCYAVILARRARTLGVPLRARRAPMAGLLVVGRDLVLRTAALVGTLSAATALAARQGATALAAHSVAFGIWQFAAYLSDGTEVAGQALVAHSLGRGDPAGARAATRRLLWWASWLGMAVGVLVAVARVPLAGLFTDDAAVAAAAATTMWWVAASQPVNAVAFALDGVLVGAGRQRLLAVAMLAAAAAFAVAATIAGRVGHGLWTVWAPLLVFMVARLAPSLVTATISVGAGVGRPREA